VGQLICPIKSQLLQLILDDFLLNPMNDTERRDLLEVLEDRCDKSSTVITTQIPAKSWHDALNDPTIADAICDRLVHNAHVLKLGGPSIRRKKALQPEISTQPKPKTLVAALRRRSSRRNECSSVFGMGAQVGRNTHPTE
jgi:hypothetical protein